MIVPVLGTEREVEEAPDICGGEKENHALARN
jgi:hypothetical protein